MLHLTADHETAKITSTLQRKHIRRVRVHNATSGLTAQKFRTPGTRVRTFQFEMAVPVLTPALSERVCYLLLAHWNETVIVWAAISDSLLVRNRRRCNNKKE